MRSKWRIPRFSSLALPLVIAAALPCGTACADEEAVERKVSVWGTAVTRVVPDIVLWRLTITDTDRNLEKAKSRSDEKLTALLGLREELGVDPKDLQTGQLEISREYDRDRHGNVTSFKHFRVRRGITLRQRDLARFDEYLARFVANADVELDFSFDTSRRLELRHQTRLEAVRIARTKAEAMTGALGARLGDVLTIDESAGSSGWRSFETNFSNTESDDRPGAGAEDAVAGTFAPGSIEVRISVHVAFAIRGGEEAGSEDARKSGE